MVEAEPSDSGFTVIEVLVALTVLAMSTAILLAVFSQGLDRARSNELRIEARNLAQSQGVAPWLDIDRENFKARVVALPRREDVQTPPMNEQLIVELYSK